MFTQEIEFEQIYQENYRRVLSLLHKKGLTLEEARDLSQEVFIKVYKKYDSFEGKSKLSTWIFKVTINEFNNYIRGNKTLKRDAVVVSITDREETEPAYIDIQAVDPQRSVLDNERRCQIKDALSHLPPRMQECMKHRIIHGLKYREIAGIMGLSIETVKSLIFQAKDKLKEHLEPYFGVDEPP